MQGVDLELLRRCGEVREHEPMARYTTLGVGGPARIFFKPSDRASLVMAMQGIDPAVPCLPLGRGSNLLVLDGGFDGIVIDLGHLNRIECEGRSVTAEAGARMSRVASLCAQRGLSGLEFLATVPGDIGGGIAMNAGAFGQQVSDCLQAIECVLPGGEVRAMDAAELDMGYRRCRLPAGAVVLQGRFVLQADDPQQVRRRIRQMRDKRGATQPLELPNCGSVFTNPPGDHAARLIEAAGLKGMRHGRARISEKHANFIVTERGARAADVLALIRQAKDAVRERFGIELVPEVRIVGGER